MPDTVQNTKSVDLMYGLRLRCLGNYIKRIVLFFLLAVVTACPQHTLLLTLIFVYYLVRHDTHRKFRDSTLIQVQTEHAVHVLC